MEKFIRALKTLGLTLAGLVFITESYASYHYYKEFKETKEAKTNLETQIESLKKQIAEKDSEAQKESDDQSTKNEKASNENENLVDTSNWQTYTNSKYGYSFKYPADYSIGECSVKPCSNLVTELQDKDQVSMFGDVSEQGWPYVTVNHAESDFYNPGENENLVDWLASQTSMYDELLPEDYNLQLGEDETDAVSFLQPQSPQAYATREIFFAKNGKLFEIQLIDYNSDASKSFYDAWIETFNVN